MVLAFLSLPTLQERRMMRSPLWMASTATLFSRTQLSPFSSKRTCATVDAHLRSMFDYSVNDAWCFYLLFLLSAFGCCSSIASRWLFAGKCTGISLFIFKIQWKHGYVLCLKLFENCGGWRQWQQVHIDLRWIKMLRSI